MDSVNSTDTWEDYDNHLPNTIFESSSISSKTSLRLTIVGSTWTLV